MSQPEPAASAASASDDALFTADLSGPLGPESGGQKFGRILLGGFLMVLGAVLALACGVAYLGAWFWEATFGWAELLGDGLLFVGALFLGLAIFGFELMRRGKKAKVNYLEALSNVPGVDSETINEGPVLPAGYVPPTTDKPLL